MKRRLLAISILLAATNANADLPRARLGITRAMLASLVVSNPVSIASGSLPTITLTGDVTGSGAGGTINDTAVRLTGSGGIVTVPTATLNFGTNPSTSGSLNFPNATSVIDFRNALNSADLQLLSTDSSNDIYIGDSSNAAHNSILISDATTEFRSPFSTATVYFGNNADNAAFSIGRSGAIEQLQWDKIWTPSINQVQQSDGSNPIDMTIAPQAPGAGAASSATGTPGSLVLSLAAPVSTGAFPYFTIKQSASTIAQFGTFNGSVGEFALYAGGVTPSTTNESLFADGTNTVFNASSGGVLALDVNGAEKLGIGSAGITIAVATQDITAGTNTTFTLSSAQYLDPYVTLTGALTAAAVATVALPSATGMWWFDISGVTFTSGSVNWKCGAGSASASISSLTTTSEIVQVVCRTTTVSINQ